MPETPKGWLNVGRGARALSRALGAIWPQVAPLDLRIVGRTLLHAAVVGTVAGVLGAAFFAALELGQRVFLERIAGYAVLRARGETFLPPEALPTLRAWVLVLLPAAGALASGLLTTRFAPEAAGGGGDAAIEAFHHHGGAVRRRIIPVKALAAICTLASGGSGGREGPTMQIGGAVGSLVGRYLPVSARERRVLAVAGIAAGIAAVFRTPLGAALFATEVLYRDDFEGDALVPAVLASVVSYSIVILAFGETTLFGALPRYPFVPAHLPLYAVLALVVALAAAGFLDALRFVQRAVARIPVPAWARPALGGLAVGLLATPLLVWLDRRLGIPGQGFGILGGGYGAAQLAISGGLPLPAGWWEVAFFALLFAAKMAATSLTIGSGGAAGDFAPSMVMGGLVGGAFGRAALLVTGDPRIAPGAFALVGMGTFYGGIAHVPLSSLVLVSELAGSYDLLVPMMLAEGIAFVALRHRSLYPAQARTQHESPAHRDLFPGDLEALGRRAARDLLVEAETEPLPAALPIAEVLRRIEAARWQAVFPVRGGDGKLEGLVDADELRGVDPAHLDWAVAADLMGPLVAVRPDDGLHDVGRVLLETGLRQVVVVDGDTVLGLVGADAIARAVVGPATPPTPSAR